MRGISKPWPPGGVSPEGHEPCSLRDAEDAYLAALPAAANKASFARAGFDQLNKRKLREEMYREQRSICVFCERQVDEGNPTPRIDHRHPLSVHPEFALHWKNLYLSYPSLETCDAAKGDQVLRWDHADEALRWPTEKAYDEALGFTSLGELYVRDDVVLSEATRRALLNAIDDRPDGPRTRKAIVNLNHPALVAARAAAIDSERTRMERDFEDQTASRPEREERARAMLASMRFPPFVSIRVAWLRKTLGRGR